MFAEDTSSSESESERESTYEFDQCDSSQESDNGTEDTFASETAFPMPFLQLFHFLLVWQATYRFSSAALLSLLKYLKAFCVAIAIAFQCVPLQDFSNAMPLTKAALHKCLQIENENFTEYVVCPKCAAVYSFDYCKRNNKFYALSCVYKALPNHPHSQKRKECGAQLMRTVRTKSGSVCRPIKVFPYQSIKKAIASFTQRPGFVECCELWRKRSNFKASGYLADVYDGEVWNQYSDFLEAPYNYLLTLNIDWFSPYEHGNYSVGAMYLTIQNLPLSIRNNPDNIILVGVIPGPGEPHLTVNSYLTPLIEELHSAWNGFQVVDTTLMGTERTITVRLALTCVACDIPATRKVCGFLGHRATLGCNKCFKKFEQIREDGSNSIWTNYGGFNRSEWNLRTGADHRQRCSSIGQLFRDSGTKSSLMEAESRNGLRYSVLLDLPYFDPIRYPIIDPMHNLFLGTGKRMMEVWLRQPNLLSKQNLEQIESLIKKFVIPEGMGRLPSNITSHFGGFTADQWRSWITIYSPVLMWHVLGPQHWNCWILFVQAVKIIICRVLTISDLHQANDLLQEFCTKFQELYGDKECTINMHLHLHLINCLQDYGPSNAFWLYAFERYNGILGSFPTNNIQIESQIMKRFLGSQYIVPGKALGGTILTEAYSKLNILSKANQMYKNASNLCLDNIDIKQLLTASFGPLDNVSVPLCIGFSNMLKSIGPFKDDVLSDFEALKINNVMQEVFGPGTELKSRFYIKFRKLLIGDDIVGSSMYKASATSTLIMAYWPSVLCTIPDWNVGEVQYFLEITAISIQEANNVVEWKQIFAFVLWKKQHAFKNLLTENIAFICETEGNHEECKWNYLPVHRIARRCAHVTMPFKFPSGITEVVTVACPLHLRLKL